MTLIGTLANSKLPFFAEVPEIKYIDAYKQKLEQEHLWRCRIEDLYQLKAFYVCQWGEIKAPPVLSISRNHEVITIDVEGLIVNQSMSFSEMGLLLPDNHEIIRGPIGKYGVENLVRGDTLYGNCCLKGSSI